MSWVKKLEIDQIQSDIRHLRRQICCAGIYALLTVSTTPYEITSTKGEHIFLIDASASNIIINLPTAVANTAKFSFTKIDSSANTVEVFADGTETINGDPSVEILFQWTTFTIVSDGLSWYRTV